MPPLGLFFAAFYFSALLTALTWNIFRALAASVWLQWHRLRAPSEDGCSNPVAVAFLIHGTWAPHARWTWPGSQLRQHVEATLGEGRIRFESFPWSGRNRISARREAAARLRAELARSLEGWRGVPHYVIAHSHGGNIALSALDSSSLADRVAGVICLSTPFLHARARNLGAISSIALSAAPAVFVLAIGRLVEWRWPAVGDPAIVVFVVLAGIAALMAPRVCRRIADHLQRAFVSTCMSPERVLIIRTPGDEASAALGAAHLVSWLIGLAWSIPSRAIANAVNTVEQWNAALAKRNALVIPAALVMFVVGGYLVVGDAFQSRRHCQALGSTLLTTSLTIFAIRLKGGTYGVLIAILFAGFLVAPVPLLLGLAALPISPELAVAAVLLEITAESTPQGVWTIQQLGGTEFSGDFYPGRSMAAARFRGAMMHSLSYEHPVALQTIATWLASRHRIGG